MPIHRDNCKHEGVEKLLPNVRKVKPSDDPSKSLTCPTCKAEGYWRFDVRKFIPYPETRKARPV